MIRGESTFRLVSNMKVICIVNLVPVIKGNFVLGSLFHNINSLFFIASSPPDVIIPHDKEEGNAHGGAPPTTSSVDRKVIMLRMMDIEAYSLS